MVKAIINAFDHMKFCLPVVRKLATTRLDGKGLFLGFNFCCQICKYCY